MTARVPLLAVALLLACSSRGDGTIPPPPDATGDTATADTAGEVGLDTALDVGLDSAPDAPLDAPPDAALDVVADVVADAPPACRTNADCRTGMLCSAFLRRCVECASDVECPSDRPVCLGGICNARTACMSSRTCPGGVCDMTLMSCVTCSGDVDCARGERCAAHTCVPTVECRSSAQCSALNMVCDATAGRCVDCVADADCGAGAFCATGGLCRRTVCTPSSATCIDTMTARVCDSRGSASTTTPCATGQSCVDGRCMMRVCTPGTTECVDTTRSRTCRMDGFGFNDPVVCATDQVCRSGSCMARVCVPGATDGCASGNALRVCSADGSGFTSMTCPSAPTASGVCMAGRCTLSCGTLTGDCDGVLSNGCETTLLTNNAHCGACGRACATGQHCTLAMCVANGTCPSACATSADCLPCRGPADTGNYCCISGLCLYTTATCGGTVDGGTATDGGSAG